jgi:hypothetical protein
MKIEASYLWDPCCTPAPHVSDYVSIQSTPYLYILYNPRLPLTFSYELAIFALYGTVMALRKNRVRSLHDRLKLIHEVGKNPGEKRVDIAKRLRLPASILNTIFAKKNDIREQV